MFILNFFKDMLGYLGLYKKNATIMFLGLDNAGFDISLDNEIDK